MEPWYALAYLLDPGRGPEVIRTRINYIVYHLLPRLSGNYASMESDLAISVGALVGRFQLVPRSAAGENTDALLW